jgi:hypothetical protein
VGVLGTLGSPVFALAGNGSGGSKSLGEITAKDFSDVLGSEFRLEHESGQSVSVRLTEAEPLDFGGEFTGRRPFSIIFRAPREAGLTQDTYTLRHRQLGSMRLFLVPVDLPRKHVNLQAVFS